MQQETEERLAAKKKKAVVTTGKPHVPAPRPGASKPEETMGSFVRELLARGMKGQELANAIHAEQDHRKAASARPAKPENAAGKTPAPPPVKAWSAGKKKAKAAPAEAGELDRVHHRLEDRHQRPRTATTDAASAGIARSTRRSARAPDRGTVRPARAGVFPRP